jgi:hypothetical protein
VDVADQREREAFGSPRAPSGAAHLKRSVTLAQRLEDWLAEPDNTLRKLFSEAGVSGKVVNEVREGWEDHEGEGGLRSKRKTLGLAESLTRLSAYLGVPYEIPLREIGIWDDGPVTGAARKALLTTAPPVAVPDHTLERLAAERLLEPAFTPRLRIGFLKVPPFHEEGRLDSFGRSYTLSLVRSVSLDWDVESRVREYDTFPQAEKSLLSHDGEEGLDLVFGLFDVPARREHGIQVIPLPGIRFGLGAVTDTSELSWPRVLNATGTSPQGSPH